MPRGVPVSAACILLGTVLWTARLLFGPSPWGAQSSALLALGLLVATAVNVVALLLAPGRWVRNAIAVAAGAWAAVAIALKVDLVWIAALATLAAGVGTTWTRPMESWFHEVKPDRVPKRATILTLGLVWLPAVVGGLGVPDVTPAGWVMAAFGLVGGWAYARALPGSLWAVRLVLLPLGVASVPGLRWAAGCRCGSRGTGPHSLSLDGRRSACSQPASAKAGQATLDPSRSHASRAHGVGGLRPEGPAPGRIRLRWAGSAIRSWFRSW